MFDQHVQTLRGLQASAQTTSELWAAATELGYADAALPELLGGSGAEIGDVAEIVRAAGQVCFAAPVGIANLVIAPALAAAGWTPRPGMATIVLTEKSKRVVVEFGHDADAVYTLAARGQGSQLRELDPTAADRQPAGMSRPAHAATIDLEQLPVLRSADLDQPIEQWRLLLALEAALQIDGAIRHLVSTTVDYLGIRQQFGRSLLRFQAIQHRVADLSSRASMLSHILDEALDQAEADTETASVVAMVAAVEAADLGGYVVAQAHQLHGAIGYTQESGLGMYSTLIWQLIDRSGSSLDWSERLGSHLLGDRDLWQSTVPCGSGVVPSTSSAG